MPGQFQQQDNDGRNGNNRDGRNNNRDDGRDPSLNMSVQHEL